MACSAFLPLSISFGGKECPHLSAVIAGELIAFYQLGYGVAAFGIGPLHDPLGLTFSTIFAAGTLVALPLVAIAYFLVRGGAHEPMEGKARARNVVIEFPSIQAARECYNSPEYQAAKAIRVTVADAEMVLVEGV